MAEEDDYQAIGEARQKLRALKKPVLQASEAYKSNEDPRFDPRVHATSQVLNSLDVLADYLPTRVKTDSDYRAMVLAAIAYIDKQSEFHLEVPTVTRRQNIGIDYTNIVRSDPVIEKGLDLITAQVKRAEYAAVDTAKVGELSLPDRVEGAIKTIHNMPVSKEMKR